MWGMCGNFGGGGGRDDSDGCTVILVMVAQ